MTDHCKSSSIYFFPLGENKLACWLSCLSVKYGGTGILGLVYYKALKQEWIAKMRNSYITQKSSADKHAPFNIWILRYDISLQSFHQVFVISCPVKLFHFFLLDVCFVLEDRDKTVIIPWSLNVTHVVWFLPDRKLELQALHGCMWTGSMCILFNQQCK